MRIDPSLLKQLLQLQLMKSTASLPDSSVALQNGDTDTDFAELLQTLISGNGDTTRNRVIPAAELLARGKGALSYYGLGAGSGVGAGMSLAQSSGPSDYDDLIRESSGRYGVAASLVKAVIRTESGFNADAVSRAGAKGLMQLMDATGQSVGVSNPYDPAQNIEGGTRYLSALLRKYNGHEGVALAAYNAGPGRVDRLGIRTDADLQEKLSLLPRETQNYVAKVRGYKQAYLG